MKNLYLISLISLLSSCGALPQFLQEAEHAVDDTAISVKISQEALQRQTNARILVELDNGQSD